MGVGVQKQVWVFKGGEGGGRWPVDRLVWLVVGGGGYG